MDFIILPQYFTLYHLFIQDVSLTHKHIICLPDTCAIVLHCIMLIIIYYIKSQKIKHYKITYITTSMPLYVL